jgi:hypothetical protein
MTRRRSVWGELFLEALVAALAEGVVTALGWLGRKLYRKWRRWRRR